jgi:hypothetical protein
MVEWRIAGCDVVDEERVKKSRSERRQKLATLTSYFSSLTIVLSPALGVEVLAHHVKVGNVA